MKLERTRHTRPIYIRFPFQMFALLAAEDTWNRDQGNSRPCPPKFFFYMNGSGTYGGYNSYSGVPPYFIIKIPDAIPPLDAPPTYVIT